MSIFRLQQFTIDQSKSGMKICSDSLLFGALIPVKGVKRILDIGAGTGILSLMQAQKSVHQEIPSIEKITAVELTPEASEEARKNFVNSPWSSLLTLVEQDIQSFSNKTYKATHEKYDLIISNPPFFSQHSQTNSDNNLRRIARHSDGLPYQVLCDAIANLLAGKGIVYLLLPTLVYPEIDHCLQQSGLSIQECIKISETKEHPSKVMVLKIIFNDAEVIEEIQHRKIFKFDSSNSHTSIVKEYLAPFLLRYK